MDEPAVAGELLSRVLDAAEAASPLEAVEGVTGALAASLGAGASFFLIADMSGRGLVRLSHVAPGETVESGVRFDDEERGVVLPFDGGPAEESMRTQTVQVLPPVGGGRRWGVLAPVTERGEVLGLLQMSLPAEPDEGVLAQIAHAAHVLSFVVIANRRHTDLYEWGQRTTRFTLPAEIQRRLLPAAFTCEAGAFTLSAWLEPAASIGGDTFDYCLGRNGLHLSVTDAMGHGVASALTATLCVGSLRNSRRAGSSLLEQAAAANVALFEHASGTVAESFSTGLLGRLDLRTGCLVDGERGAHRAVPVAGGTGDAAPPAAECAAGHCSPTPVYHSTDLDLGARVTGWCWSPTGCSSGTRRGWTWSRRSSGRGCCIPGRRRGAWRTWCWRRVGRSWRMTRRC